MKYSKTVLIGAALFLNSGCLLTRADVKEAETKRNVQDQVINMQKSNADQNSRFIEINSELRDVNGRVDVVENKINIVARQVLEKTGGEVSKTQEMEKRLGLLQEEVARMEGQIVILNQELQGLKSGKNPKEEAPAVKEKNLLELADDQFQKKEWKKAILTYQRFRDQNPKSKKLAKATLRIGISFQELGMSEEAKTFFDEVSAKYPESAEAKTAKSKLKKKQ